LREGGQLEGLRIHPEQNYSICESTSVELSSVILRGVNFLRR
jgi:hypothetical protein